jgi:hypothetical protein
MLLADMFWLFVNAKTNENSTFLLTQPLHPVCRQEDGLQNNTNGFKRQRNTTLIPKAVL